MIKKILLPLFALALGLVSCERDDDKYISTCPIFQDVTFTSVVSGTEKILTGEPFVATAKQAKYGHLLYKAKYVWSDGREVGVHSPAFTTVVYDNNPNNPVDTIVFYSPGVHQVKLVADYDISGYYDPSVVKTTEIAGGRIQYELLSAFKYRVTITKNVHVEPSSQYYSVCPTITDMNFKSVGTDPEVIQAGTPFVASIEQSELGRNLFKAEYEWSDGRDEGIHKPAFTSVVYDSYPDSPTDTIVFNTPGIHQVKLVAKYYISSNADASVVRTDEIPGGQVQYQLPSWLYYLVTVTKNVRVLPAP